MSVWGVAIKGLDAVRKIGEYLEGRVHENLNIMGLMIVREAKRRAPVGVSGLMRSRIVHEVVKGRSPLDATLRVYVPVQTERGFPYAVAVEYGTKPHMPPVSALALWAKRKGVNPWAIAYSIKKFGTKPHPFLNPAAEEVIKSYHWRW